MGRVAQALAFLPFLILASQGSAQDRSEPLETGLEEKVEVRYVILDALVLDARGRVVPGLTVEDFKLYVDLYPYPIASLDLQCPSGVSDDPRSVEHGQKREAPVAPELLRRIALVVDYENLPQTRRAEVIGNLEELVRSSVGPNDEVMVVAVTRRLRIEQPFTRDRDEILAALDRMREDPTLWQVSPVLHYDEFELYDALVELIRAMGAYEGNKAIVLVSDMPRFIPDAPFGRFQLATPAAFHYDPQHNAVATAAMDARVPIYPVQARGLSVARSSDRLARLAVETGGRFTQNTNDLSLAYARAQRDLACRYAVGFYDKKPDQDRVRRVNLKVRRPGLRVIHPRLYRFGSAEGEGSLEEAAYAAPLVFRSEAVRGGVFPVQPIPGRQWNAAVALNFSVSVAESETRLVEFGAKLTDAAKRFVHSFDRSLTVGGGSAAEELRIVVVEPVDVEPGEYELSVVVNDPGVGEPRTSVQRVELPALPRRGLVVAEPLLVRRAAADVVVHWSEGYSPAGVEDDGAGRELLLSGATLDPGPLTAVSRVCWQQLKGGSEIVEVERAIRADDGELVLALEPAELEFAGPEPVACHRLLDELPAASLLPGSYEFELVAHSPREEAPVLRRVTFSVRAPG